MNNSWFFWTCKLTSNLEIKDWKCRLCAKWKAVKTIDYNCSFQLWTHLFHTSDSSQPTCLPMFSKLQNNFSIFSCIYFFFSGKAREKKKTCNQILLFSWNSLTIEWYNFSPCDIHILYKLFFFAVRNKNSNF